MVKVTVRLYVLYRKNLFFHFLLWPFFKPNRYHTLPTTLTSITAKPLAHTLVDAVRLARLLS